MNGPTAGAPQLTQKEQAELMALLQRTPEQGAWLLPCEDGSNITAPDNARNTVSVGDRLLVVVPHKGGWANLRYAKARYDGDHRASPFAPDGTYRIADGVHTVTVRNGRVTACTREEVPQGVPHETFRAFRDAGAELPAGYATKGTE